MKWRGFLPRTRAQRDEELDDELRAHLRMAEAGRHGPTRVRALRD